MNLTTFAAVTYAVLTALAVAFQLALAAGAPWGAVAMGGRWPGRLPTAARVLAVAQAGLLGYFASVVLAQAGLGPIRPWHASWQIWLVVAMSAASFVMNVMTPSTMERRIWAPFATLMLASSLGVALGA